MEKRQIYKKSETSLVEILKYLALAGAVVGAALLCVCHSSCQLTSQGIQALEAEESPQISSASIVNASSIEVTFTKGVNVQKALVSRLGSGQKASLDMTALDPIEARAVMSRDNRTAIYVFDKAAKLGERYQLFSEIKDSRGNSLTFALPFDGFNERIPRCAFTEVQPKAYNGSKKVAPESAYVIIRALQDGNLFGIDLYSAAKGTVFDLPNVEVKAGEEIILHLRSTKNIEDCQSELGNKLDLASTGRASKFKRDLYFDQGVPVDGSNDVLLLRDKNANKTMDAIAYFSMEKDNSTKWKSLEALKKAIKDRAWQGDESADSCFLLNDDKNKCSSTKPLVRTKIPSAQEKRPSNKFDWSVAGNSVY